MNEDDHLVRCFWTGKSSEDIRRQFHFSRVALETPRVRRGAALNELLSKFAHSVEILGYRKLALGWTRTRIILATDFAVCMRLGIAHCFGLHSEVVKKRDIVSGGYQVEIEVKISDFICMSQSVEANNDVDILCDVQKLFV